MSKKKTYKEQGKQPQIVYLNDARIGDIKTLRIRSRALFNRLRSAAVTAAWEREVRLVEKGFCTRKWTLDQQKELLETGTVRGYQGHHMKSATRYPVWAGQPENIQFLQGDRYKGDKNCEHTFVHKLNPDMSTNGYYNVEHQKMIPFGDKAPTLPRFELPEKYMDVYCDAHNISHERGIHEHEHMRRRAKVKLEKTVREKGIEMVYNKVPSHPNIVEMIFEHKFKVAQKAWAREVDLVQIGYGTRQWSLEEQRQLLEFGKADKYEPHHMKSSFTYPQYADNIENIQFLRRNESGNVNGPCEHLDAHSGNPRQYTNGYYDPVTRKTTLFGDGPPMRPRFPLTERIIDTPEYKVIYEELIRRENKSRRNKQKYNRRNNKRHGRSR